MTDDKRTDTGLEGVEAIDARIEAAGAELARLRRELEHCQRLATLGTMAAGLAHEVNNLLTPALGYAQILADAADDGPGRRQAATRCAEAIESASRIIQATLDLASARPDARVANVREALAKAVVCLGREPARDRIDLEMDVPDDATVTMPPQALQQVLLNLLLNSVRVLAPRGGGAIVVRGRRASGGRFTIEVADDGPGVPPAIGDRLFEPFVSAPAPGADASGHVGSGLGLALCRQAIEEASGTISSAAAPGGGACFRIELAEAPEDRQNAA